MIRYRLMATALILVLWFISTVNGFIDPIILPTPASVGKAVFNYIASDNGFLDIWASIKRVFISLVLACVIGIPLGLYFGLNHKLYTSVEGVIHALRSVPATALFPLFVIVVGVGETSIVFLATYPCLLIITVNTIIGVNVSNLKRRNFAFMLGATRRQVITEVLFYEALPSIFSGVRTSISYSFALVLAIEMFVGVGEYGLGKAIYDYQSTYRIPEAYATIIIAAIIGIILNRALTFLEDKWLHWIPNRQIRTE